MPVATRGSPTHSPTHPPTHLIATQNCNAQRWDGARKRPPRYILACDYAGLEQTLTGPYLHMYMYSGQQGEYCHQITADRSRGGEKDPTGPPTQSRLRACPVHRASRSNLESAQPKKERHRHQTPSPLSYCSFNLEPAQDNQVARTTNIITTMIIITPFS